MANSEYNLTVVDGTALTISLSGPVGPAGAGGGGGTVDAAITDSSTNAVSGNAVFDALALKAPLASPSFTGTVVCTGSLISTTTAADAEAIYGHSETGSGVVASSSSSTALYAESESGMGINASTVSGTYHALFGDTGINQSFVARVKGAFGWIRDSFTGRIQAADTLTANRTYTLPDATGIVPVFNTLPTGTGKVLTSSGTNGDATWENAATGSGSVTSVSVTTANGVSGSVATSTTTPAITLSLGNITPSKVNGLTITAGTGTLTLSSYTLTVAGTASVSGTNTGDQTNITGNAATVTTNANLTGHVTSTGNAAVLGSFTIAELNTAVSDADVAKIDAQIHTGAHAFSSTTRPTSSGSGTPADISLVTRTDVDTRLALNYLRGLYLWSNKSSDYGATNVGTGGSATNNDVLELTTGTTANSVGFLRSNIFLIRIWHISLGAAGRGIVNWSLRTIYNLRIVVSDITGADTVARFLLGQTYSNTTAQDLTSADKGIGFKIVTGLVYVQVANATILTTTSTATTISSLREYDFTLDSDGTGNWVVYINGSNVASGTGAPTGNSTATNNALCMSITNGTTASNRQLYVVKQSTLQIP